MYRSVLAVLQNPFYAGAYAYGKSSSRTQLVDGRLSKSYGHSLPMTSWGVLLRDHHAGYIDWEVFERNQERLRRNAYRQAAGRPKSARGGHALLTGLLRCGRCGRMLLVTYNGRRGRGRRGRLVRYACRTGNAMHGLRPCITFGAQRPDDAVAAELLRVVEPLALEAVLMATRQIKEREDERRRALALECEQARYEVQLAARRYEAVDPDYRLVAGELEARWDAAIVRLRECEQRLESLAAGPRLDPDVPALERLAHDLPAVWSAASAEMGVKQRLLRTLIEEIVVDVDEPQREVVFVIHWTGGQHSALRVRKPGSGEHRKRAPAAADHVVRAMASTWSDEQMATALNRMRLRTGQGQTWTARRVASYRRKAEIAAYAPAADPQEWVTMRDAAKYTGVTSHVIRALIQHGVLPAKQVVPDAPWQIRVADLGTDAVRAAIARRHSIRRPRRMRGDDRTLVIPGT